MPIINLTLIHHVRKRTNGTIKSKSFAVEELPAPSKHELQLINENRYETTFKAGEVILKQGSR
jgi:hypothetical protein